MAPTIRVEGIDELRRDLRKIKDVGLNQGLRDANKEIADAIVAKALPNVPVLSGRLRESVRGLGNLAGALGKAGNAETKYAAAIHWGRKQHGAIPARPFLRKAAEALEGEITEKYRTHIDRLFGAVRARGI